VKELKISIDEVKKVLEKEFGIINIVFINETDLTRPDDGFDSLIHGIIGDVTT